MIATLRESLRWLHYARTRTALAWCLWRYERARHDLADATAANDRAWDDILLNAPPPPPAAEVPAFLIANVTTLKRSKKA